MWKKRVFLFLAGLSVILTAAFINCSKTVTEAPQRPPAPSPVPGPLDGITVCVAPGHGGYDGGARGQDTGALEKDVNLAVALCLRQALQDAGAQVILTRETDTALAGEGAQRKRRDLQQRVDTASGAQVFLSIHMNEYRTRAESGPQVFYRAGQDDSRLLAGALQAQLIAGLAPARQRSAHTGEYYLLEHLQIPAVLVECGFLSNAAEEQKLLDPAYQQRVAQAICAGVTDFVQLQAQQK
mgnify:FL=1